MLSSRQAKGSSPSEEPLLGVKESWDYSSTVGTSDNWMEQDGGARRCQVSSEGSKGAQRRRLAKMSPGGSAIRAGGLLRPY
jgi:hypothetical protein